MFVIDSIIKLILAVLKILVDYKTATMPESTEVKQSAKEQYEEREQKFNEAIVNRDPVSISAMFEQLRCASMVAETGAGSGGEGENSDSAGGQGDNGTGQRILSSVGNVASGAVSSGESVAFAPSGVPRRTETNRIVWHHSASSFGDAATIDRWHKERGFACIGYHYVIPKQGHFEHGRKCQLQGAHATGRNADSIGVCFIGHLENEPLTLSQIDQAVKLYHDLCRAYSKTLVNEFHHEECPGKLLNRDDFVKMLSGAI